MDLIDLSQHPDDGRESTGTEKQARMEERHSRSDHHTWVNLQDDIDPKEASLLEEQYWNFDENPGDNFPLLDGLFEPPSSAIADAYQIGSSDRQTLGDLMWNEVSRSSCETDLLSRAQNESQHDFDTKNGNENSFKIKPPLSRRKSNPFYSPSQQILEMVKKRKRSKTARVSRSQSSSTVPTLRQIEKVRGGRTVCRKSGNSDFRHHDKWGQISPDAGSSERGPLS